RLDWTTALDSNTGTLPNLTMTSDVSSQIGGTVSGFSPGVGDSLELEWSTFGSAGPLVQPTVNVATARLTLGGSETPAFSATGTFSISSGQVTGPTVGSNANAFAFTLDASGSGGGVGAAGSIKVVSITQGPDSWLGIEAHGISLTLTQGPVAISLTNGELQVNRSSTGTNLNWSMWAPTGGIALPHLDITAAVDLHVAGTIVLTVDLAGLGVGSISAKGTGTLDIGTVSDA